MEIAIHQDASLVETLVFLYPSASLAARTPVGRRCHNPAGKPSKVIPVQSVSYYCGNQELKADQWVL